MSSIHSGLTDFLDHISRQPFHPTLVERYLSLALELPAELRRDAMEQLNRILLEPNASLALRSNYHYLQYIRESSQDADEEIFVLRLIQVCFRELGRSNHALIIGDEITRITERLQHAYKSQLLTEKSQSERSQVVRKLVIDFQLDPFDQLGQEILVEFMGHLGSMPSMRHQTLAMEKLVQGLDALYQKSGPTIADAIRSHGRNPLVWNASGEFRLALAQFLLSCRVFQMGKDKLTPMRIQMMMEILTAYYDQRALGPASSEKERSTRLRLLSEMINVFLDAGVSFHAYAMGAS